MQRTLRYDGLLPAVMGDDGKVRMTPPTPDEIREMKTFVKENRTETTPFDIIMEGQTPGDDRQRAAKITRQWADAGVTWWIEAMWSIPELEQALTRIRQGPPRLECG